MSKGANPKPSDPKPETDPTPTPEPETDATPDTDPKPETDPTPTPEPEKEFSQAEVEAAVKKALKEEAKKTEAAEARAKLSEEERAKAENDDLRRENRLLKAESTMVHALKNAGANSPELMFKAISTELEFDKDGKLSNSEDLITELKSLYPEQFGTPKPKESIDGGAGVGEPPKDRAKNLNEALGRHYNKKK